MIEIPAEKTTWRLWLGVLTIFVAAYALYARSFGNDWTLDDLVVIIGNPDVRSFSGFLADSYPGRPLRELTFLGDFMFFGIEPAGWHLQSIFWHGLNAVLLALLALRLGLKPGAAWVAAVLFLVHPLHVEAVANLSNRKDSLALAFSLLALLAWLRGREGASWPWRLTAVASFAAACLAKEAAYVLPLVVLLHEAVFVPREERLLLRRKYLLLGAAGLIGAGAMVWLLCFGGWLEWLATVPGVMAKMNKSFDAASILSYFGMMVKGWGFMLVRIVWPLRLAAEYVYPAPRTLFDPLLLTGMLGIGGLAALCGWAWFRQRPFLCFGLGWFILFWLPVSNLWPLSYFAADRYYYAPLAGLALLVAAGLDRLPTEWRRFGLGATGLAIVLLALLTWQQNGVWRNQGTLWTQAVAVNPTSTTALTNLAVVHMQQGDLAAARPLLEKAARNLNNPLPWYYLGRLYELQGDKEKAAQALQSFLSYNDSSLLRERNDAQRRLLWLRAGGR